VEDTTLVVDEQPLEVISLEVESSIPTTQLSLDKDINIVRSYLSLKKVASLCHHPTYMGKKLSKLRLHSPTLPWWVLTLRPCRRDIGASSRGWITWGETLLLSREDECQLKRDVKAKSLKLAGR